MFNKVYGFTGTPWNSFCYHDRLGKAILDEGTDGYSIDLLLEKAQKELKKENTPVMILKKGKSEDVESTKAKVKAFFKTIAALNGNTQAFIDSGAIFKGISNVEIAREILKVLQKQGSAMKGVVFFHHNELVILEAGQKKPIPLSQSRLKPEERFTFYDDAHTIGADIVQKFDARAVVSIGENISLKDLLQAVWRMRGLGLEQIINFILSEECQKVINHALGKEPSSKVTTEDILLFSAINQASRQGDDLLRASKQKIVNEIRNVVLEEVLGTESTLPDEAQELFNLFDLNGLFCATQENEPFKQFGEPDRMISAAKMLKSYKMQWAEQIKQCIAKKSPLDARPSKSCLFFSLKESLGQEELFKEFAELFEQDCVHVFYSNNFHTSVLDGYKSTHLSTAIARE